MEMVLILDDRVLIKEANMVETNWKCTLDMHCVLQICFKTLFDSQIRSMINAVGLFIYLFNLFLNEIVDDSLKKYVQ